MSTMISGVVPWDVCCAGNRAAYLLQDDVEAFSDRRGRTESQADRYSNMDGSTTGYKTTQRGRPITRPAPPAPQTSMRLSESPYRQSVLATGGAEIYPRYVFDRSKSVDARESRDRTRSPNVASFSHSYLPVIAGVQAPPFSYETRSREWSRSDAKREHRSKSKSKNHERSASTEKRRHRRRTDKKAHRRNSFVPSHATPNASDVPVIKSYSNANQRTSPKDQICAEFVQKIGSQLDMMGITSPTHSSPSLGGQSGNILGRSLVMSAAASTSLGTIPVNRLTNYSDVVESFNTLIPGPAVGDTPRQRSGHNTSPYGHSTSGQHAFSPINNVVNRQVESTSATTTTTSPLGVGNNFMPAFQSMRRTSGGTASQLAELTQLTSRSTSPNVRSSSRINSVRLATENAREISVHELTSEHVILREEVTERDVIIPKLVITEEIFEKEIIIPETRINEEIIEARRMVKEKVVEVQKTILQEKIIEVPEIVYVEKIIEVPEKVVQERIVEVPVVQLQERLIEIPKYMPQEKIVDVIETEVVEVPVEKIIEKIIEVEEIVVREKFVPRYVDKPIPQYVNKQETQEIERNIPVPIESVKIFEFKLPKIRPRYVQVAVPIYAPRFVEVALPAEYLSPTQIAQCEQIAREVALLAYASSQRAISLCEIERVGAASKSISPMIAAQLNGADHCQSYISQAWNCGEYTISDTAGETCLSNLPVPIARLLVANNVACSSNPIARGFQDAPRSISAPASDAHEVIAAIESTFGVSLADQFVEMVKERQTSERSHKYPASDRQLTNEAVHEDADATYGVHVCFDAADHTVPENSDVTDVPRTSGSGIRKDKGLCGTMETLKEDNESVDEIVTSGGHYSETDSCGKYSDDE